MFKVLIIYLILSICVATQTRRECFADCSRKYALCKQGAGHQFSSICESEREDCFEACESNAMFIEAQPKGADAESAADLIEKEPDCVVKAKDTARDFCKYVKCDEKSYENTIKYYIDRFCY